MSDRKAIINIGWGGAYYGDIEEVLKVDELLSKLTPVNTGYTEADGCCAYVSDRHKCGVDVLSRDYTVFNSEEDYQTQRKLEEGEKE